MLLFAAGEIIDDITVEKFDFRKSVELPDLLFCLQYLCREAIRRHMINLDPHTHLFSRIPKLGLPTLLTEYLLYDVSLDEVNNEQTINKN